MNSLREATNNNRCSGPTFQRIKVSLLQIRSWITEFILLPHTVWWRKKLLSEILMFDVKALTEVLRDRQMKKAAVASYVGAQTSHVVCGHWIARQAKFALKYCVIFVGILSTLGYIAKVVLVTVVGEVLHLFLECLRAVATIVVNVGNHQVALCIVHSCISGGRAFLLYGIAGCVDLIVWAI